MVTVQSCTEMKAIEPSTVEAPVIEIAQGNDNK